MSTAKILVNGNPCLGQGGGAGTKKPAKFVIRGFVIKKMGGINPIYHSMVWASLRTSPLCRYCTIASSLGKGFFDFSYIGENTAFPVPR